MYCPYCHKKLTEVINSRPTHNLSEVWRRRKCLACGEIFTTHEVINLSHLRVIKKSGRTEVFSRIKLYSGIYGASIGFKAVQREKMVDKITREIEKEVLFLKQKKIPSETIAEIALKKLIKAHTATFLRFFAQNKHINNEKQMKKELARYLEEI